MHRFLKADNLDLMKSIIKCCNRRPTLCDLCHRSDDKGIHTTAYYEAQYLSALKHLLSKKTKKKKKKTITDVLKGSQGTVVDSTTHVDVMRGKQLSALANQLSMVTPLSHGVHTTARRTAPSDAIRNYDPLVFLPNEMNSANIDITNTFPKKPGHRSISPVRNRSAELQELIESLPLTMPELIDKLTQNSSQGEIVVKIDDKRKITVSPLYIEPERKEQNLVPVEHKSESSLFNSALEEYPSGEFEFAHFPDESIFLKSAAVDEEMAGLPDIEVVAEPTPKEGKKRAKKGSKKATVMPKYLSKKNQEAVAKQKILDLERNCKQESLNENFLSFCDVSVNTGMTNDAFLAVKSYRRMTAESPRNKVKLNNLEIYNTLIRGFALEGNSQRIGELLAFIREDGLTPDAQTYAGILECLGRRTKLEKHHLSNHLKDMERLKISLNDVFHKTVLCSEGRKYVLTAIHVADPDFVPQPIFTDRIYDCPLLNHLNDETTVLTSPVPPNLTAEQIKSFFEQQLSTEKDFYVKIKTIDKRREGADENIYLYREKLEEAQKEWKETAEMAFDRDLQSLKAEGKYKSHIFLTLLPYLKCIPKEEYIDIILQEIRKRAEGSETYSPTTKLLFKDLGMQVFVRYQLRKKQSNGSLEVIDELFKKYCEWYANPDGSAANTRQKWQQLMDDAAATRLLCGGERMWRPYVLVGIGRFLYNVIIRDIKIDVNVLRVPSTKEHKLPAFYTIYRYAGYTAKEELKPHPTLSRLFRSSAPDDLVFEASKIPMLCPPLPWTTITSGGYLVTKTDLIRLPYQAVAQWKALKESPPNKLFPAFDSLNQLGAVPWTVNQEVLDVILSVFNAGGSAKLDVPEPPSACPPADPITPEMTHVERSHIFKQRLAVRRRRAEMYSLWCDALYKLSLANHFRKEVFWLPHNMDFRGRVYPVAPHLNHLGSDLSRSLLMFAKGQPLGPDGFDWLKIHAINLTGTHKKKSVKERLEYATEIMDDILDSANDPLNGRKWWAQSEEPWQTLATCIEIRNALNSGDPPSYVSSFPVHQDGSCNGLQHYAALGRDQAGGESVNLTPAELPQDVYSCVAAIVERERAKDAANGLKIAQDLEGFIYRKVIKQTVMTTVYGVTRYGARLQIARQLKDLDDFPKQHIWQASMYLVNKTFDSIQEMFTSTKEIQDWFTECARLIAQVCCENVQWVTPLGLPIVQPYCRNTSHSSGPEAVKFIGVQSSTITDVFERPNIMKQKNAFAPNFVHSLDSSHMMLTSIMCERLGVTFVSVHDCYWTHACSVAAMNRVCRDQFVALHSQPILADLSDYFVQRFAYAESSFFNDGSVTDLARRNVNRALRSLPSTGNLDLQAVLKSPYFFS